MSGERPRGAKLSLASVAALTALALAPKREAPTVPEIPQQPPRRRRRKSKPVPRPPRHQAPRDASGSQADHNRRRDWSSVDGGFTTKRFFGCHVQALPDKLEAQVRRLRNRARRVRQGRLDWYKAKAGAP